jgi:formylglycine-generating enzyme required for sulfatase activity
MKKILILASNPKRDLNLDREIRDLKGVVERSIRQDQLAVEIALAVRPSDLQDLLFSTKPQIVHFCGHGTGSTGLVLEDEAGKEQLVTTEAISDLFRLFASRGVECVLLNACYSEVQANAIVQHINTVIGMKQEIRDDAAIAFATGFYRALAFDCSMAEAFEFGCNAIQLQLSAGTGAHSIAETSRKAEVVGMVQLAAIPEHLKPILKQKTQPTPRSVDSSPAASLDQIQIQVDLALETETALKQYREQVREFLANRTLSEIEKIRLKQLRQQLGLTIEDADRILAEEQIPIHQGQQAYRDLLIELIQGGCYPFDEAIQTELKQFQQEWNLTDSEAAAIADPILASALLQPYQFEVITLDATGNPTSRRQQTEMFTEQMADGVVLEMVAIPAGRFWMGSPLEEEGRSEEESPQHSVSLAAFFVSKYPITQAQWRAVATLPNVELDLHPNPAYFIGETRPVEQISWHEAVEFCQRLTQKTGRHYRLLSEAEWEYACRAGTTTPFHFGATLSTDLANFNGNYVYGAGTKGSYRQETTPVGMAANGFGLYDLHGNVWEWCADPWHPSYDGAPTDGSVWLAGGDETRRLLRGGAWFYDPWDCRSAYRVGSKADYKDSKIGFRVACSGL